MSTTAASDLAAELDRLSTALATSAKLTRCPNLLALVPPVLLPPHPTRSKTAKACRSMLEAVADRAYQSRRSDPTDELAGQVLAAGAVLGLITQSPPTPPEPPHLNPPGNVLGGKPERQILAAAWLTDRKGSDRGFRYVQATCLRAFEDALQEWVTDEDAVTALAQALRPGAFSRPTSSPSVELQGVADTTEAAVDPQPSNSSATLPGVTAEPPSRPDYRSPRRRLRLAGLIATPLLIAALIAAVWVHAHAKVQVGSSSVVLDGQVTCQSGAAVTGLWVQTETGANSGWAHTQQLASNMSSYEYALPSGTRYSVHVGCGGTSTHWASDNRSGYVSPPGHSFSCTDHPAIAPARTYGLCIATRG